MGHDDLGKIYVAGAFSSEALCSGENNMMNTAEFAQIMFIAKLSQTPMNIASESVESIMEVYPNPCDHFLYVRWRGNGKERISCRVKTLDGRCVQTSANLLTSSFVEINTSQLSQEFYVVEITAGSEQCFAPVVVN